MSNARNYNIILGDGQQTKPGYIWNNPATQNLSAIPADINADLAGGGTTGPLGPGNDEIDDSVFRRLFSTGTVSAQQAYAGMASIINKSMASLPASLRLVPISASYTQTRPANNTAGGTIRYLIHPDILLNLNKYYKNFWKPKFDANGENGVGASGVDPYRIRRTPIVEATFQLHGCTFTSITTNKGISRVSTGQGTHGFYTGMRVTISGTGNANYDGHHYYVDKIASNIVELYTDAPLTAAANFNIGGSAVTGGTMSVHVNETHKYKMVSLKVRHWGERKWPTGVEFSGNLRVANNIVSPAQYDAGDMNSKEDPDQAYYSRWASITCATRDGYLSSVSLSSEYPGQYADPGWGETYARTALLEFKSKAAATATIAGPYTAYEWETVGYDPDWTGKVWPTHVRAMTAKWNIDNPTAILQSQSGRTFTRTSGMPRYKFTLQYPPMTREDFRPFLTAIMQARGQHVQFHLPLSEIVPGIFDMNGNATIRVMSFIQNETGGTRQFTMAGGDVLKYQALRAGDTLQIAAAGNGELAVVTHDAHTSAWGSADIRTTVPFYRASANEEVKLGTAFLVASLDDDKVDISVDQVELYGFSLTFVSRVWS
jgi:hypothetical protein